MVTRPLTVPLAQAALHNALLPDRQYVERPKRETIEVAAKKKFRKATAETRVAAVARTEKLIAEGRSTGEAVAIVAKELGVNITTIYNWRAKGKQAASNGSDAGTEAPVFDGLDLILDILDLCERAKKGLSRSQRARLKAAVNERL